MYPCIIMTEEEQMYIEADNYLKALSEHKSQEEAEKVFSSFDMKEAAIGLLKSKGFIDDMNSGMYVIMQLGKAELKKGGLHKQYLDRKAQEVLQRKSARWSKLAAVTSIVSAILAAVSIIVSILLESH